MAIRVEEIDDRNGCVDIDRDRLLVVRHQKGDHAAFDELYRRYHGRLVVYCQRRVGDRHVAEELAQEAFVRALRAMPRFAGERRFYPWMTVIAQRLCIDHHRKSSRVEPSAEVDAGAVEADHEELWAAVDRDHLGDAVARLAPRHREILELREQRGWSYQQIADHLDVPMTTVEALLHRARKALRREYLSVAGDDAPSFTLGRLAGFGGLAAALARAKDWLAALGPDRLIPAVGAAAAGVAAVGAVVVPTLSSPADADQTVTDPQAEELVTTPTTAPGAPVTTVVPSSTTGPVLAVDGPGAGVVADPTTTTASPLPDPAIGLGAVAVYDTPEGEEYVNDRIDCMPMQVDLGPLLVFGVDPGPLLDPLPLLPGLLDLLPDAATAILEGC